MNENKVLEERKTWSMGTANPDIRYISIGIKYDEAQFMPVKNRSVFSNFMFPPSKPVSGGFWGAVYTPDAKYRSEWERFIMERMYLRSEWTEKTKQTSTVFSLKSDAKIVFLNKLMDLFLTYHYNPDGSAVVKPLFDLRKVKIGNPKLKDYENHLYIDFEKLSENFDALLISKYFASTVDWTLKEFERRVHADENPFNEKLTKLDLDVAEMFEDWNVESILILNNGCMTNIEYIDGEDEIPGDGGFEKNLR